MVASPGGRVAQARVPARRDASGVPRDDLPHAVHPGPRGSEERAVAAPKAHSRDAPLAPPHAEDTRPWPDQRDGVDPRAAGRGGRSGGTRSLGRRSVLWQPQQPGRQLSGAPDPLPHAGEGSRQGHRDRGRCAYQASPQVASRALQVADLGPWRRDGGPSTLLVGHRYQGLLLRSAAAVAARLEREHNGLLRQYFPKGMDLSDISQSKLNAIARRLNERPRKTLGFETPAERFAQCVASI